MFFVLFFCFYSGYFLFSLSILIIHRYDFQICFYIFCLFINLYIHLPKKFPQSLQLLKYSILRILFHVQEFADKVHSGSDWYMSFRIKRTTFVFSCFALGLTALVCLTVEFSMHLYIRRVTWLVLTHSCTFFITALNCYGCIISFFLLCFSPVKYFFFCISSFFLIRVMACSQIMSHFFFPHFFFSSLSYTILPSTL